ncbi:MAG: methylated-DNA--[protein]-cysteine S-methyltransferase [Gemmatimonadota bacterium]|nr:methylated-DNA--[protein]-cysteine S-methyltransferase [Gemmatimonadota bacterium]
MEVHSAHVPETRAGPLTVWASSEGVRHIEFGPLPAGHHADPPERFTKTLTEAVRQLREYLSGARTGFDLPLDLAGVTTDFQRRVYERLRTVGYGQVTSYGHLADALGGPELARAVGRAVGANPLPIVIPCHRVVGSEGRLTGFGGGLPAKVALLRLEGIDVDGDRPSSRVRRDVIPLDL